MKSLVLLIFSFLSACSLPKSSSDNFSPSQPGQIVLVGRIILNPPITESEKAKSSSVIDLTDASNKAFIRMDAAPQPRIVLRPSYFDKNAMNVYWNKLFYVSYQQHDAIYVSGVYSFVFNGNSEPDTIIYPIRGYIRTNRVDKTFYIGDIHIERNEFSELKAIRVQDRYNETVKEKPELKGMRKSLFVVQ